MRVVYTRTLIKSVTFFLTWKAFATHKLQKLISYPTLSADFDENSKRSTE